MNNSEGLFVRTSINISESYEWDMLAPYSLLKNEYIDKESEKQIIISYANAVNVLCNEIKQQNHAGAGVVSVLRTNSLTIPFMFLVRHTLELIIKRVRKSCKLPAQRTHNLISLWNDVIPVIKKKDCGFNDSLLSQMSSFIKEISFVDNDGTKTRYSHDNAGVTQNREPIFIHSYNINTVLQGFVKLTDINFEGIDDR